MPNWVRNNVTISRLDKDLIDVQDFCSLINYKKHEDFTLNDIIKEPTFPHFDDEEIGKENILSSERRQWRCSAWGVKWNVAIISKGDLSGMDFVNQISLSFDTAWTSPMPALIRLSELLGEDYDISLEASDEFLGNHCDYNLKINNGDVVDIPIEGDYDSWWDSVWGYDEDDGSVEFISSSDVIVKANKHSENLDDILQSLLISDVVEPGKLFIETGEDNLWELDTTYFTITVSFDKVKRVMLDCIVVYKTTNQPIGVALMTASVIADKLSRSVL